jgi:3-hydroxyisobutyrate dehydrogenase-like beta-hydroxyacid dehydrogenase
MTDATHRTPRIAVVGLGNMGLAIAERILDAEYPLSVFNRTPGRDASIVERGAERLDSAGKALQEADVCVTMLADDAAVEAVACGPDGILAGARPGSCLVDMSTISVAASARVAEQATRAGVSYLRAPVSGNPVVVRGGGLTIFVSGPADVATEMDPVLHAIGPNVRYVGEGELARVLKLVFQVVIGGTAELLAEALVLGEAAGLERKTILESIAASVVGSPFVRYKTEPLLNDDYSATFTTAMMIKDVELVLDLCDETGVELPLTRELRRLLEVTAANGHSDEDFMALFSQLQQTSHHAPADDQGA